jgi:hypothetical protein
MFAGRLCYRSVVISCGCTGYHWVNDMVDHLVQRLRFRTQARDSLGRKAGPQVEGASPSDGDVMKGRNVHIVRPTEQNPFLDKLFWLGTLLQCVIEFVLESGSDVLQISG